MRRWLIPIPLLAAFLAVSASGQEILLDQMVQAGPLKCYPVHGDPTTWYYLPDQPHLVTDADGNPEFSFLVYVTPQKHGEGGITKAPGGGILHFLVAFDVPQDQVRQAQGELGRRKPGARLVAPVSYADGTFALVTAVTDPQAGLSRRVVGVGNAPVMAGHKAAVSIHLTPEGASLLWESFKQRTPDISVNFEMTVAGYRNPVEASMLIDYARVNQTMQIQAAGRVSFIAIEVDALLQKMRDTGAIKVELKGAPPAQWNDIQTMGLDLARQHLFENTGASGLASATGAGQEQSPLDRLWKAYGDEWKQQSRSSALLRPLSAVPWVVALLEPGVWSPRAAWYRGPGPLLAATSLSTPAPESLDSFEQPTGLTPNQQRAKELFTRAQKLYQQESYADALALFEQAYAHYAKPAIQWNIAQTHVKLGHRDKAVAAFGDFIFEDATYEHAHLAEAVASLAAGDDPIPTEKRNDWTLLFVAADKNDKEGIAAASPVPPAAPATDTIAVTTPGKATGAKLKKTINPAPELPCRQEELQEGERLFREGIAAFELGDLVGALRLHERSFGVCPASSCRWNLARIHLLLCHRDETLIFLDGYLADHEEYGQNVEIKRVRELIAAAPEPIPDDRCTDLNSQFDAAEATVESIATSREAVPAEGLQPGAAMSAAAGSGVAAASGDRGPAGAPPAGGATPSGPKPTPIRAAATKPTATPRPPAAGAPTPKPAAAKPTPTPKPKEATKWGVIASFKFRRIERTGAFALNLKQWLRSEHPVRFASNLGDLSRLMSNPRFFRRVNLDDPVFKQREIPVSVDVRSEEAFAAMLNSVTATIRKVHASGKETLDEVTIARTELARPTPMTLVYGWDQDDNRTRWLEYDVRLRWSYSGGPVIETPWQRTSAGALALEPPLRPRTLLLTGDMDVLRARGVRDVVVEVSHTAGATTRKASATIRVQETAGDRSLVIYQDPQQTAYTYTCTWRLAGGQRLTSGPREETADIIYTDEVPARP